MPTEIDFQNSLLYETGTVNGIEFDTTPDELKIRNAIEHVTSANCWQGIELPPGYEITNNKLCKMNGKYPICRKPIVLSAIGENIDSGEFWYKITFMDPLERIQEIYAKHEQIIKKNELMKITNQGILVDEKKGAELCEYLADSIDYNATNLKHNMFVSKNGWKNNNEIFVLGNQYYSSEHIGPVRHVNEESVKGLTKKGTLKDWVAGTRDIIAEPIIRFKCYCAVSSNILRLLDMPPYIVDHNGNTSTGKTLSTKFAFSMYGNPEELMLSGQSTPTYLEEMASNYDDFALCIDETSLQSSEILTTIIYMFGNGSGKGRGKKDGGVRKMKRWKSVAFTTGEKPIADADGFGGQQVRVVEIQRELPKLPEIVKTTEDTLAGNYGHVGELFIRKVFEHKDELRSRFAYYRDMFTNNESSTMNRAGTYFAAIAVAGELLEEVFDEIGIEVIDHLELVKDFFNETVKEKPIVPYPVKALRAVNGWFEENRGYFVVNDDMDSYKHAVKYGWITRNGYLDIITSTLKDAMKMQNINLGSVLDSWEKDGIITLSAGRKDFQARHSDGNGGSPRIGVYRFNLEKMREYLE